MLTKKDLIALADTIRVHNNGAHERERFSAEAIFALAQFCKSNNPNFRREQWLGYIEGTNGPNGGAQ